MEETIEKLRKSMDTALLLAENYQNRCHDAENLLIDFHLLKWWQFGKRKKLNALVRSHHEKFINVDFGSYIKSKIQ